MDPDVFSLPKRSAGEKNLVPPPKQLKLEDLSMWRKLPYDNKYPIHNRTNKDTEFFTSELGKSLYEQYPGKEFELTSDKKHSIPLPTYISFHDPYLKKYFDSLPSFKRLVNKGLITPDGKVKVNLPEFNRYRMYLHHIWIMHMNHLRSNHQIEEQKRLQCLLEAVKKENSLCMEIVEEKDDINADVVMKDLAAKLEHKAEDITEHEKNPLVQSLIDWHSYQNRLQKTESKPNNGLLHSYKVDYRIAKCKKTHTILKELMLPVAVTMANIMKYFQNENFGRYAWIQDSFISSAPSDFISAEENLIYLSCDKEANPLGETSRKQQELLQSSDEAPRKRSRKTANPCREQTESTQEDVEQK
ncbi:uncharacterized protein NPIL_474621 [Nephila pilipes]|uniref:Uncharacterized protein n=1 Tax=Nephila pilipes TaxID=299642 RepID=A0A8X6TBG9_NEPPI|nr:uncharacterized protein NPIL_474621 [Nephila pilipes]